MNFNFANTYAGLPSVLFADANPTPVRAPKLFIFNDAYAQVLGLTPTPNMTHIFSGNEIPEGAKPLAQAYAGHQFGHFTMLGDGRAILLGEHVTPSGARVDIQLKGPGQTPFSRRGDGRAALGPMLREYIISEAMHGLGIPTTRSLAVVTTGEPVYREEVLQGAILTRVAASHIRVGTFEYVAAQDDPQLLKTFTDYVVARHDPALKGEPYLAFLEAVIDRQAALISKWLSVGFIHGVMNTDNMAISGETIDYGPCAFMDTYDPNTVFSSIDRNGRYAYGNQPYIAEWNLTRLAEALFPLIAAQVGEEKLAIEKVQSSLESFKSRFATYWQNSLRAKLGLLKEFEGDIKMMEQLLNIMHEAKADFTQTFTALTYDEPAIDSLMNHAEWNEWQSRWQSRERSRDLMRRHNPVVIPRNYHVEAALKAAESGNVKVMQDLLTALKAPYQKSPKTTPYETPPPQGNTPYKTFCGT